MMRRCCKKSDVWIKIVSSFPALRCRVMLSAECSTAQFAAASKLYEKQKVQDYVQEACPVQ